MAKFDYKKYGYKYLRFSKNWNNKLFCHYFTAIRKVGVFKVGDMLRVECGALQFDANVWSVERVKAKNLTDRVTLLDSGLSREALVDTLFRIYGHQTEFDVLVVASLMDNKDFNRSFL